jgi:hypothetical protein
MGEIFPPNGLLLPYNLHEKDWRTSVASSLVKHEKCPKVKRGRPIHPQQNEYHISDSLPIGWSLLTQSFSSQGHAKIPKDDFTGRTQEASRSQ